MTPLRICNLPLDSRHLDLAIGVNKYSVGHQDHTVYSPVQRWNDIYSGSLVPF